MLVTFTLYHSNLLDQNKLLFPDTNRPRPLASPFPLFCVAGLYKAYDDEHNNSGAAHQDEPATGQFYSNSSEVSNKKIAKTSNNICDESQLENDTDANNFNILLLNLLVHHCL